MNKAVKPKMLAIIIFMWLILSACGQADTPATPMLCNSYPLKTTSLPNCIALNTGTLIQTALNQQSQVFIDRIELTIQGTVYIQPTDNKLSVAVLEGTTLIGIANSITSVYEHQEITIDANLILSDTQPYDIESINALPLNQLERSVTIILPTATVEVIPTQAPDCPRPDNWIDQYTVKSGDTLTTIAKAIGESLIDLQSANCIDNPNNLRVGQILIVPQGTMPTPQLAPTFTPSAVFFRADSEMINSGSCTVLRWDIQNIRELLLDEDIVSGQTSQEICPALTTSYTLTVRYFDDTQSEHHITITVNQP